MLPLSTNPPSNAAPSEAVVLPTGTDRPFVIELTWEEEKQKGSMKPRAALRLNPSIRTSGLLAALPADELKSLLFVLTFLHPNGYCQASVPELCHGMRLSELRLRGRMRRLADFRWQGRPVLVEIKRESGLDAYTPTREVLQVVERVVPHEEPPSSSPLRAAGRQAVIDHSRANYARPRAEVEAEIARLNGWEPPVESLTPEERHSADLRSRLEVAGVPRPQADILVRRFDHDVIERQLGWLPHRAAKSPGRFLVAAIQNNYEPPIALRKTEDSGERSEQGSVPVIPRQPEEGKNE